MKYIKYTYVDAATKKPVSEEGARRGPTHPDLVTPTIGVEESYQTGVPLFYGIVPDNYEFPYWMNETTGYGEVTEEEFFAAVKFELIRRATVKKDTVEVSGIYVGEQFVRTDRNSQNRIAGMITLLNNNESIQTIDFEISDVEWITIDRATALSVGVSMGNHVQQCFSWKKDMVGIITQIVTLEDAGVAAGMISSWTGTDYSQQPEME